MTVAATAMRRRSQAANGYKHVARLGRPIVSKKSQSTQERKRLAVIQKQRDIALRKGMSKR